MSATTLKSKLEALQCHFTWDLDPSRSKLFRLRANVEDIGTEEGNYWLGHVYNLRGYIQYKLGLEEDAESLFSRAAEAFRQTRGEGPWLLVTYGNLAWLHHRLGQQEESQAYLSKVDALMKKHPCPSQDELHAEVYAEKAWTLMKFDADKKKLAAEFFQRAIRMQPDVVEWNSSYFIGVANADKHNKSPLDADVLERMRIAKERDPENLYLAARYLDQLAKKGERIKDEARELGRQVSVNPVSSYSGLKAVLRLYRSQLPPDEAIELAEEALETHPDERYLKRCAALCYKWKILFSKDRLQQSLIEKAISLHEEVISLYPDSSLAKKTDLASIYAKSADDQAQAEQMYQDLLRSEQQPPEKQMLFHNYAKYLFFDRQDRNKSIKYHMKAAEIPHQSFYRQNSIRALERIRDRGRHRMCREIAMFLDNLPELEQKDVIASSE